jgi:hypothetical protein
MPLGLNPFSMAHSGYLTQRLVALMGTAPGLVTLSRLSELKMRGHALDELDGVVPWEIAVDEALDGRHPAVALAWTRLAATVEFGGSPAEKEAFAVSLAHSMAGRAGPDGLDPDYAIGAENSRWAAIHLETICARACQIALALRESREIGAELAASMTGAPSRSRSI